MDESAAAALAVRQVEQIKRAIGIPERLREIGATADQLPQFAGKSFAIKRLVQFNPRPVSEADLLTILQDAL